MQRVEPVHEPAASGQVLQLWEGVERLLGRVPNAWRVLAHSPDVATWLLPFCATLHRSGTGSVTEPRYKNLVALKTSMVNECDYCTSHNLSFGKGLGLTDAEIEALSGDGYRTSEVFDDRDKAAIWWGEEVTRNTAKFNKECFATLQGHFSDPEIVELTLMAGLFSLLNRFNDSLFIDIEDAADTDRIRRTTHLSRAAIHDYARAAAVESGDDVTVP